MTRIYFRGYAAPLALRVVLGALVYLVAARVVVGVIEPSGLGTFIVLGAALSVMATASSRWLGARVSREVHARTFEALLRHEPMNERPFGPESDWETYRLMEALESLLATQLPQIGASVLALLVLTPFVGTVPSRSTVMLFLLVVVVTAGLAFSSRRWAHRELIKSSERYHPVAELVALAATSRLELAANGAADHFQRRGGDAVLAWQRGSVLRSLPTALFRRAHVVAFVVVFAGLYLIEGPSLLRDPSILLAAALAPPLLALLTGTFEAYLQTRRAEPLLRAMEVATTEGGPRIPVRAVRLERFSFAYGDRDVLEEIDLTLTQGFTALSGENASGKSTLLKSLLGYPMRARGRVLMDGEERRAELAYLAQAPCLRDTLTVREILSLFGDGDEPSFLSVLERFGLLGPLKSKADDPLSVKVGELSVGQKQRLALARIFVRKGPRLLLLDEPDASLDAAGLRALIAAIAERKNDAIVLVAAHSPELLDAADRVVRLERGRVVEDRLRPTT